MYGVRECLLGTLAVADLERSMNGFDAGGVVPVYIVKFFDGLIRDRASIPRIVQSTATWLGRSVAVDSAGAIVAATEGGQPTERWPDPASSSATTAGMIAIGAPVGQHDDVVLDRLGLCVALALGEARRDGSTMSEQRAVEVLTSESESRAARRRACEHLGVRAESTIQVMVCSGAEPGVAALVSQLERSGVRVLRSARGQLVVLAIMGRRVQALLQEGVPRGLHLGLSQEVPVMEAPTALAEAVASFRFSQPSPRDRGPYLVEEGVPLEYRRLSGYEALAEGMTPDLINRIRDVRSLDQILEESGPEMRRTLDVVAAANSVRQAARWLETHHNTVAHRMAVAEETFGFSLMDAYGRGRLYMAIVLRRIRESHALL